MEAVSIKVNKNINAYKTKDIGVFTLKEAGYLALAGILGYIAYLFIDVNTDIKIIIVLIIVAPILYYGFGKKQGIPIPKYLKTVRVEKMSPNELIWKSDFEESEEIKEKKKGIKK